MPDDYFLTKWFKENDITYLDEKLHYSSHYGTFAHIMMALLLRHGKIDMKSLDTAVDVYWSINELEEASILEELATKEQWTDRIRNDLLCIVAFIQEREFEAIAIEWMGQYDGSDKVPMQWAGTIDLVGYIQWRGKKKRVIIDLKTGSLYNSQVFQLIGNKLQWEQHNPDLPIDMLFNLQPKDFTNKSKFKLKNRKVSEDEFATFCDYARIANRTIKANPKPITDYDQELTRETDLDSFSMSAEEYVIKKHTEE
jgi:hypothetical protein